MGPSYHVLDGGVEIPTGRGTLGGNGSFLTYVRMNSWTAQPPADECIRSHEGSQHAPAMRFFPNQFEHLLLGATENARPKNAGLENDGQLRKESQGLENAGLENDGQNFSQLWAKLRGLENAGLENDGPC